MREAYHTHFHDVAFYHSIRTRGGAASFDSAETIFTRLSIYPIKMSNPFADPTKQNAENPFEDPYAQSKPYEHRNDSLASIGFDSGYPGSGQAQAPARSQRSLELERRERAVRDAEANIAAQRAELNQQANNWPPFYPLIHHDIADLPEQHRTVGKLLYFQWLALAATLIVNLVGCVLLLVGGAAEGGADMGASVMYVPVIGAASFFAWYRPIYLGLSRTEGRAMAFWFCEYIRAGLADVRTPFGASPSRN